jgi:hypothetical protein
MKKLNKYITEKLVLSKRKIRHNKNEYFYHEALEDGYSTKFIKTDNVLQYSIDNCQTWHKLDPNTETPEINKEEYIYFKCRYPYCHHTGIGEFESEKKFNVGGNIMSLIYGDDFEDQTELLNDNQFKFLFNNNRNLISAKDLLLPATKLVKSCYAHMFMDCSSLLEGPELHAPELSDRWNYYSMFANCTSLNAITMLATNIIGKYCLDKWVCNVSKTGTFIKAKDVDIPEGVNGIPKGWTVKEI